MPMASAGLRSWAARMASTGCLMPRFSTSKPLLERMISTRFLPMSCTSPFTVARIARPLVVEASLGRWGSMRWMAAFMASALSSTKGSCISPAPKRSPTTFMAPSSTSLMRKRGSWSFRASSTSDEDPLFLAVQDVRGGGAPWASAARLPRPRSRSALAEPKTLQDDLERVVALGAPVEEEILDGPALVLGDPVPRE